MSTSSSCLSMDWQAGTARVEDITQAVVTLHKRLPQWQGEPLSASLTPAGHVGHKQSSKLMVHTVLHCANALYGDENGQSFQGHVTAADLDELGRVDIFRAARRILEVRGVHTLRAQSLGGHLWNEDSLRFNVLTHLDVLPESARALRDEPSWLRTPGTVIHLP